MRRRKGGRNLENRGGRGTEGGRSLENRGSRGTEVGAGAMRVEVVGVHRGIGA